MGDGLRKFGWRVFLNFPTSLNINRRTLGFLEEEEGPLRNETQAEAQLFPSLRVEEVFSTDQYNDRYSRIKEKETCRGYR